MPPLLTGFVAALALTPVIRWIAIRTGDIDRPIGLKIHERSTPLMGGVALYGAFLAGCVVSVPLSAPVRGVLVGGAVAIVVGLVDEFASLPPRVHLLGQIAAAVAALWAGVHTISTISTPFSHLTSPGIGVPLALGVALTLFWIVGMINTVNFLDGLDGLAPGVCAIAAAMLAAWAWDPNRFSIALTPHREDLLMPLALFGALLGFLPYNWRPARIFSGDSGSTFLGLALASLSIVGPAKLATALLVLLIPVLDVAWAIVRRRFRGRSSLAGDKQHVYHRLLELGVGYTKVILLFYGICITLAVLDLLLYKQWKLLAFVVVGLLAAAVFVYVESAASSPRRRPLIRRAPE